MQITFNTQTDDLNELLNVLGLLQEAIKKKHQSHPIQQNTQIIPQQENQPQNASAPLLQQVPDYGFKPEENMGVASAIGSLVQDLNKERENSRLVAEGFFRSPKPVEIPNQVVMPQYQNQQPQQVQEPKKTPEKTAGGGRVIPFIDLSNTMGKIFSSDYGTKKEGRKL